MIITLYTCKINLIFQYFCLVSKQTNWNLYSNLFNAFNYYLYLLNIKPDERKAFLKLSVWGGGREISNINFFRNFIIL